MRGAILDEILLAATPDVAARTRRFVDGATGNIITLLVAAGFPAREVLQAACAVTGIPPAPRAWLLSPTGPVHSADVAARFRRLQAAPVQLQAGRLCVAYADPEAAAQAALHDLPPHTPYLALEADLERALQRLGVDSMEHQPVGDGDTLVAGLSHAVADAFDSALGQAEDVGLRPPRESNGSAQSGLRPPREFGSVLQREGTLDATARPTIVTAPPRLATPAGSAAEHLDAGDVDLSLLDAALDAAADGAATELMAPVVSADDSDDDDSSLEVDPLEDSADPSDADGFDDAGAGSAAGASDVGDKTRQVAAPPQILGSISPSGTKPTQNALRPPRIIDSDDDEPLFDEPRAPRPGTLPSVPKPEVRARASGEATRKGPPPTPPPASRARSAAPPVSPLVSSPLSRPSGPAEPTRASAKAAPGSSTQLSQAGSASGFADRTDPKERGGVENAATIAEAEHLIEAAQRALVHAATAPPSRPLPPATEVRPRVAVAARTEATPPAAPASPPDSEDRAGAQRVKRIAQINSVKRFQISRVLGRGGMATVYYAIDTKSGEEVALKIMEPHLAEDEVFVERFKREIRASASLKHDNIVRVVDAGEENGTYYMAAEYVDAGTVSALLRDVGKLPVAAAVAVMVQVLEGLQHAHERGLIHRDLKPANLMLTSTGVLKVCDFGIAKATTDNTLTKTGALFGTPAYMSPEQATGKELDTRSDLFGLGIIFYELLAGYNPFAHENPSTTMFAIAKGQARPLCDAVPILPLALENVVNRLLERDRDKRYQSADEARVDLLPLLTVLRDRHGNVLSRVLADARNACRVIDAEQSKLEMERAHWALSQPAPEVAHAAWCLYRATLLDGQNYEAVNELTQMRADHGYRFTRPDDKQMLELEQSLEKKADQPAVLRRLSEIASTHRNLVDMSGFMKRYLRLMPGDLHVQAKLDRILGHDPLAPWSKPPVVVAAAAAVSVDEELQATIAAASADHERTNSGSGSGVRPAARPGARPSSSPGAPRAPISQASSGAPAPSTPARPTPAVPQPPVSPPRRAEPPQRAQKAPPSSKPSDKAPPPEQAPRPAPEDSLAVVVESLRSMWVDFVHSLTGGQGFEAVREYFRERFGKEGRADIKDELKDRLGAGRAVAGVLVDAEGRQVVASTARGLWRQHRRLILLVAGVWILILGLGRACAYACADGDDAAPLAAAPAPAPAPAPPAPSPPAKGAAPTPAAATPAPVPAPPGPAVDDGEPAAPPAVQLTPAQERLARQSAFATEAAAENDPEEAVRLYGKAIDIDPNSKVAQEALIARARLHLAAGRPTRAEADLFKVARRLNQLPDPALQQDHDALMDEAQRAKAALLVDAGPP